MITIFADHITAKNDDSVPTGMFNLQKLISVLVRYALEITRIFL